MAETCAYLRGLCQSWSDVGKVLTCLNDFLAKNNANERFVSLFFAQLDPRDRSFAYASAGHPSYLFDAAGTAKSLQSESPPLGVEKDLVVPASEPITLQPGQTLLLITDGIPETQNADEDFFGRVRVFDIR